MKYLKGYKIFESKYNLSDLEDILRDITDSGHRVDITVHEFSDYDRLDVFITFLDSMGNRSTSDISEYVDCLKHLISHLNSEGWIMDSGWTIMYDDNSIQPIIRELDLNDTKSIFRRVELRFDKFK